MHWYNFVIAFNVLLIVFMTYRMYLIQSALTQSLLDNTVAIAMLKTMKEELENSKEFSESSNEDFIKFLSDSRDWAFNYIENTIEKVNDVIEYCRAETNKSYIADYRTGPILMNIVNKLLPLVQDSENKKGI